MAAAYATPASGGMYCEPQPVDRIVDMKGKVIKEYTKECRRVMSHDIAAQINDILTGLQKPGGFGYANGTALKHPVSGQDRNDPGQQGRLVHRLHARTRGRVDDRRRRRQGIPTSLAGATLQGVPVSFARSAVRPWPARCGRRPWARSRPT